MELYQAEWCPHSHRVRQRLTELGQNWHAHQVAADREDRDEMERAVGTREIPTLVTDDGETLTGTEAILPFLDKTFEPGRTPSATGRGRARRCPTSRKTGPRRRRERPRPPLFHRRRRGVPSARGRSVRAARRDGARPAGHGAAGLRRAAEAEAAAGHARSEAARRHGSRAGVPREAGGPPLPRLDGDADPGSRRARRRGVRRRRVADLDRGGRRRRPAQAPRGAARLRRHEDPHALGDPCSRSGSASTAAQELAPTHHTLGDVDSPQALLDYQAARSAHKAARSGRRRSSGRSPTAASRRRRSRTSSPTSLGRAATLEIAIYDIRLPDPLAAIVQGALTRRGRARRRRAARLQRRPSRVEADSAAAAHESEPDRGAAVPDRADPGRPRPDAPQIHRARRRGRLDRLDELDGRLLDARGERDRHGRVARARGAIPRRLRAALDDAGRRPTPARSTRRPSPSTGGPSAPGSAPGAAKSSPTGSRRRSAGRSGGCGSPRP